MFTLGNVAAPTAMRAPPGPPSTERKSTKDKTIRLELELFPTDSTRYPEFNYAKLLQLEKKKLKLIKQKPNHDSFDPFIEQDSDVARMAKEMEKKYGNAYASGRGRSRKDDHCDIGMGYDESDSFIDNTDAYDEIIPEEVETVEGGFYINCGALEFKQLQPKSSTTKTDEIIKMPNKARKRRISSSSEESSGEQKAAKEVNGDEKHNGESKSAKNATDGQPKIVQSKKPKKNTISSASNSPKPFANEVGSDSDKERTRQQKPMKTTTVKDMLKAKRDSFLKKRSDCESNGSVKGSNGELKSSGRESSDSEDSSDDSDSQQSGEPGQPTGKNEENVQKLRATDTKLPVLEADLTASIHQFRDVIKSNNMTGNRFVFEDKLAATFLKIDDHLLCLEKTQRNMVFAHLEYQLMLPKHFLVRKAKQLRFKEEKLKSKRALEKLKQAIYEIMPRVVRDYEENLRKFAEMQADSVNSEHPPKMPRKKFPWNSKLRNLLFDVYEKRWTSYPVVASRKQTLVEFVKQYLKEKVAELWPNGWMSSDELRKEIEKHQKMAKKAMERQKAKQAAANNDTNVANPASSAPTSTLSLTSKQLEELVALSNRGATNSDTDSVASSNATSSSKGMKSSSKSKLGKASENPSSNETASMSATTTVPASAKQKPQAPPAAHVINLDKYKTTSDILLTSQQLLGVNVKLEPPARAPHGKTNKIISTRCDSSSESDVVEIFNAELNSNKQNIRKHPAVAPHNMMTSSTHTLQGFDLNYLDAATAKTVTGDVSSSVSYMQKKYATDRLGSNNQMPLTNVITLDSDSDHADAASHIPQKYKREQ